MQKGVSPVVATVLLIAIAVMASVTVWYWVAPLTSAQASSSTTQYSVTVGSVYLNTSNAAYCTTLDISNTGGLTVPANVVYEVRWTNGTLAGTSAGAYVNISTLLLPGQTLNYNISMGTPAANLSQIPKGSYRLRPSALSSVSVSGLNDLFFTC